MCETTILTYFEAEKTCHVSEKLETKVLRHFFAARVRHHTFGSVRAHLASLRPQAHLTSKEILIYPTFMLRK